MANTTNSETRQHNREKAPDFADFVDKLRETFGADQVSVKYVKFADGTEVGKK